MGEGLISHVREDCRCCASDQVESKSALGGIFYFHNKLIFGMRMLDLAQRYGLVPDKIYSEKGRTAKDAVLHQVLV